jgi:uncharacterized protein (UPF0548 family)
VRERRIVVQTRRPDAAALRARAAARRDEPLALPAGCTEVRMPQAASTRESFSVSAPLARMATNSARARLGAGAAAFHAAADALFALRMFELPWTAAAADDKIAVGSHVAVAGRVLGLWWTNVCRVTRVFDGDGRVGFVYTTLRSHLVHGEERFTVEFAADGAVWFELFSYSRPAHALTRLCRPLVRAVQRRFAREAGAAMAQATSAAGPPR